MMVRREKGKCKDKIKKTNGWLSVGFRLFRQGVKSCQASNGRARPEASWLGTSWHKAARRCLLARLTSWASGPFGMVLSRELTALYASSTRARAALVIMDLSPFRFISVFSCVNNSGRTRFCQDTGVRNRPILLAKQSER